jgi:hypothetical protein
MPASAQELAEQQDADDTMRERLNDAFPPEPVMAEDQKQA